MTEQEQRLPADIDSERALLGAILMNDDLLPTVFLESSAFHLDSHRKVWQAMGALAEAERRIDIITICEWLRGRKWLDAVGGVAYVASLSEGLPRKIHLGDYVRILTDKANLRRIIGLADRARSRAYDSEDSNALLSDVQAEFDQASSEANVGSLEPIGTYFQRTYPSVDDYYKRNAKDQGLPFGFETLDRLTCGAQPGDFIIIAARPSVGKTALAGNIAEHVAIRLRKTVAFFSLEMSTDQLLDRIVCGRAGVSLEDHRSGKLSLVAKRYFEDALADVLNETFLLVDDTPAQTVAQMQAKAQRAQISNGLDMVIVDYLQLVKPGASSSRGENREQAVAGISRSFKALAKKLKVPCIVLAQLSREVTKRTDKRPLLSDLRESGALEQDADLVLMLHREWYYSHEESDRGKAEIIIAKQRQGPLGTAHVFYREACTKFADHEF